MFERLRAISGWKLGAGREVVASLAIHVAIVGGAVAGGGGGAIAGDVEPTSARPFLFIPMDRMVAPEPAERIHWAEPGEGGGQDRGETRPIDEAAPVEAPVPGTGPEDPGRLIDQESALAAASGEDSILMSFQVDLEVVRDPTSVGPEYPPAMIELGIEGKTEIQFVVDTTGHADTLSFRVLSATHPEFADAVRRALPGMRFQPAVVSSRRVRQLVQQAFVFRIAVDSASTPVPAEKTSVAPPPASRPTPASRPLP